MHFNICFGQKYQLVRKHPEIESIVISIKERIDFLLIKQKAVDNQIVLLSKGFYREIYENIPKISELTETGSFSSGFLIN